MEEYFAVAYKTHATNNVFPLIAIYEKVIYMLITVCTTIKSFLTNYSYSIRIIFLYFFILLQ